jgi:hypothetical protein
MGIEMEIITEKYVWCDHCKQKVQMPCGIRSCPIIVDLLDPATKAAMEQWYVDTGR